MQKAYLVFRLSYVIDSSTILPVLVFETGDRGKAEDHVNEKGGFIITADIGGPASDGDGDAEYRDLHEERDTAMMPSEMGNVS